MGVVVSCLALAGCQQAEPAAVRDGQRTIKRLAILYGNFLGEAGRPPKDEAEFRKFVERNKLAVEVAKQSTGEDDLLVSPRDGKPYVIPYGAEARKYQKSGLAAYEQEGVGGLHMVAFTIGMVDEVDEARLQEILAGG
jgi:hypothetical protein